ncbi:hypothetical protein KCG48_11265 [Proteiniclasticum sp. BAD-10]|uniref:Uncharacterized protein n=1 Tax=Proteiniclasticum sediminis TaxID=2804028 RepID=A0A941CRP1_9CLOT|nr:hypothetical protein [Proteiniclasticum sediminis]MBR0576894.1 hypothetical protein [Proteiniclasticum sediminis]
MDGIELLLVKLARENTKESSKRRPVYRYVHLEYDERIRKYDVKAWVNGREELLLTVADLRLAQWYAEKIIAL